ncbi:MAG: hypothetical protein ACI8RE_001798 [Ilumatobacter sp.]|jgi:hypothetical protein
MSTINPNITIRRFMSECRDSMSSFSPTLTRTVQLIGGLAQP